MSKEEEKEKENWSDKEYVLDRVKNDGRALQYASEDLRADKEIVLVAVENDGDALEYGYAPTLEESDFDSTLISTGDEVVIINNDYSREIYFVTIFIIILL